MGNKCCCQGPGKAATDNLNISNCIDTDEQKKRSVADPLHNRTSIQTVNIFTNHFTILDNGRRKKLRCARTAPRIEIVAQPAAQISADEAGPSQKVLPNGLRDILQNVHEEIQDMTHLCTGEASQTIKAEKARKSILVDLSRFRLERKSSVEDKYVVLNALGKGSFGEVKLVMDKKTSSKRALKVISKDTCMPSKNYADEIEILKKLVTLSC